MAEPRLREAFSADYQSDTPSFAELERRMEEIKKRPRAAPTQRQAAPSLASIVARDASDIPPVEFLKLLLASNASLHSFGVPLEGPKPRYTNEKLNAGGYTMTAGPMRGQVVVANPEQLPRENVLGHEAYHARVLANGGMAKYGTEREGPIDPKNSNVYHDLRRRMSEVQPPADVAGPHWGLRPSSAPDEQIANIVGYEASLPKGTSIMDTEVGKKLFGGDERARDYYFNQSSIPHGGIWEGQIKESNTEKMRNMYRDFVKRMFGK